MAIVSLLLLPCSPIIISPRPHGVARGGQASHDQRRHQQLRRKARRGVNHRPHHTSISKPGLAIYRAVTEVTPPAFPPASQSALATGRTIEDALGCRWPHSGGWGVHPSDQGGPLGVVFRGRGANLPVAATDLTSRLGSLSPKSPDRDRPQRGGASTSRTGFFARPLQVRRVTKVRHSRSPKSEFLPNPHSPSDYPLAPTPNEPPACRTRVGLGSVRCLPHALSRSRPLSPVAIWCAEEACFSTPSIPAVAVAVEAHEI